MSVHHVPMVLSPEESTGSPRTGVIDSCKPLCGCWELNLGPLEEWKGLVPHEPPLQPRWWHAFNSRSSHLWNGAIGGQQMAQQGKGIYHHAWQPDPGTHLTGGGNRLLGIVLKPPPWGGMCVPVPRSVGVLHVLLVGFFVWLVVLFFSMNLLFRYTFLFFHFY